MANWILLCISILWLNCVGYNTSDCKVVDSNNKQKEIVFTESLESKGMAGLVKGIKAFLGDVEMAPYTVVAEKEGYEERLYPANKWVCTTMEGPGRDDLVSPMFRKLFNYISGKNAQNVRIDMTAPVSTHVKPGAGPTCSSNFTMGFFIPQDRQADPPAPGPEVFIENREELIILTRRFGGYATDEVVAKEAKELAEKIQAAGEEGVDLTYYYVAGYDPPFKPIGRRNEIWFIKKKPAQEL